MKLVTGTTAPPEALFKVVIERNLAPSVHIHSGWVPD